jgi:predicted phosphatase
LEFLHETISTGIRSDKPILGYHKSEYDEGWQDWDEEALACPEEYGIREIIPQSLEAPADKKEELKEEPRYSMQEIKEAWDASGWVVATSSWNTFQKNITKINSPEYQEYLRLKAIYE